MTEAQRPTHPDTALLVDPLVRKRTKAAGFLIGCWAWSEDCLPVS